MTERGTQSIYDIDFAVLDEKKYSEVVKVPSAVWVEEASQNGSTTEPIASIAVATELVAEPSVSLVVTQPTEVVVHIPRPVETQPPYVPSEYVELAQTTLDTLLESYSKPVIPIALIVDTAFGQKPSKQDYENLKNALKQDPKLEYLGSRDFKVVGIEENEPYWPGESPHIDTDKVDELAERIIKDLVDRGLGKIFHWRLLESVRSEYLNSDETNETLAQVASSPEISAYENGSFSARLTDEELQALKDEKGAISLDFNKPEVDNEDPMTWHQVNRTMRNIKHSREFRTMKADAKRLANPRRRGRKKKSNLQGRTHNKANRMQQSITRMVETNPSTSLISGATDTDAAKIKTNLVEQPEIPQEAVILPLPDTTTEAVDDIQEEKGTVTIHVPLRPSGIQREFTPLGAEIPRPKQADYEAFAKKHFGEFPDINLLITAFTHRSYLNENRHTGQALEHNERLEFLGDSILNAAVTEHLYRNYTDAEGVLTQWRTALVRNSVIGAVAEQEGFESLLRLSRGEKKGKERARRQVLANCYEAVLGAVYLTKGAPEAQKYIERTLLPILEKVLQDETWRDPKSRLQEIFQRDGGSTPEYRLVHQEGPDHNKLFVVGVYIDGKLLAEGAGESQKDAQVSAAVNALNSTHIYDDEHPVSRENIRYGSVDNFSRRFEQP